MESEGLQNQASETLSPSSGTNYLGTVLFLLQMIQVVAHIRTLFRWRLPPKQVVVGLRPLIFLEVVAVAACAVYTHSLLWVAVIHNLQHVYYFMTWNKANYTKKIMDWGSSDVALSRDQDTRLKVLLGSGFDTLIHIVFACYVVKYLHNTEVFLSLILVTVLWLYLFKQDKNQ